MAAWLALLSRFPDGHWRDFNDFKTTFPGATMDWSGAEGLGFKTVVIEYCAKNLTTLWFLLKPSRRKVMMRTSKDVKTSAN